jgi:hypothetical protein
VPDAPRTHRRSAGRRRHFVVRRTPWSGQLPASRLCCRRGHRVRRPGSTAVADGRAGTVGRRRPPCLCPAHWSRGRVRGGWWPSGQHLVAIPDVQRTLPRCPVPRTPLGCGPGRRRRQTSAVQPCDRGRGLWTPAAAGGRHCGHPRRRQGRADTTAGPRWTAGSATVHRRPHVRPGTGPQAAASASTAMARPPNRSLVLRVDLVSSRQLCLLRLGASSVASGPEGSRSDRLDDQTEDLARQAARPPDRRRPRLGR